MKLAPSVLSLATFALLSSAAQAGTVFQSGDWKLDDSNPNDPNKGICQAMTAGYMGSAMVYLSLVLDKAGSRPMEIMVIPNRPSVGATALYAKTGSGTVFYLAKLPRTGASDQYWNIPVNTEKFVNDLKEGNQINFYAVSGTQEHLPLSLTGSTAVINQLEKRCAKNSLFTARAFELAFLPEGADRFNIRNISPEKAAQLRETVAAAVPAYKKLRGIQGELEALNAKFKALISEREQLTKDLDNLQNRVIPDLTNQRDTAQANIDRATAEIADLTNQIAAKQAELTQAQAAAKEAYDRLAPLIPEHDRLLSLRRADERRLGAARSNLADIDNKIASDQQAIMNLNAEADSLNRDLPRAQEEVRRGQAGYDQAQRAYQSFDPRRESFERFRQNPRARQLEGEIRQFQGQVQAYQAQVQQSQGVVQAYQNQYNQAVQALNQCRSGRFVAMNFSGRILADENGGRPGRPGWGGGPGGPGGPGHGPGGPGGPGPQPPPPPAPPAPAPTPAPTPVPTPPTPTPPNCSAQEAAVANAQNQLNGAIAQLNNAQAQLNNAQGAMNQRQQELEGIRRQIEWQVRQEQEQLAQRMNEWQQYYSRAQNTLSQIQNRLDAIIRYELPRYQNDLAAQESRRPTAVAELQSAEQSLANSSANFDRYLAATNYLNLEREANRTAGVVSQIQATIAEFQRGVANRQALIKQQTSIRDALIKRIADTNALIAQKQNRLVEVNAALAAYDAQKAEIQGRIDLAKTELKVFTDQYAASLN